jgi:hypothetical protein
MMPAEPRLPGPQGHFAIGEPTSPAGLDGGSSSHFPSVQFPDNPPAFARPRAGPADASNPPAVVVPAAPVGDEAPLVVAVTESVAAGSANGQTSTSDVTVIQRPTTVPGSANADVLRALAATLVSSVGDVWSARSVASPAVFGSTFVIDAALGVGTNLSAIVPPNVGLLLSSGSAASASARTVAVPWSADLLKPVFAEVPLNPVRAIEQFLPTKADTGLGAALLRFLRSPYLSGVVAALVAVEAGRRYFRRARRPVAAELPGITGPSGL